MTPSLRLYLTDQYHSRKRGRPCGGLSLRQGPLLRTRAVDAGRSGGAGSSLPLPSPRYWHMRTITYTCMIGHVCTYVHVRLSTCEYTQTHAHLSVHKKVCIKVYRVPGQLRCASCKYMRAHSYMCTYEHRLECILVYVHVYKSTFILEHSCFRALAGSWVCFGRGKLTDPCLQARASRGWPSHSQPSPALHRALGLWR